MDYPYVIGVDFGTDSVRSIIVNTKDGSEISSSVFYYPRWKKGLYCDPGKNQFRQHPLDYIEGLEYTIRQAIEEAPDNVAYNISAISVDTTGSTPVATDKHGTPLALHEDFKDNPNAMFILWKDHTAVNEAEEINQIAKKWNETDYTKYVGGVYSSEWFWAKIVHILREDAQIRENAHTWIEHCDWIPALLTGESNPSAIKRSRCAAGHKAMWHKEFEGLPSDKFLSRIDPVLHGLRDKLYKKTYTCDNAAGNLCGEWANRLGLNQDVVVGVGAFDAHLGAVGAEIKPYYLSKVMGTSTCDMLIAPMNEMKGKLIKGICGQVDGSIIPGMLGMEAGQSAFGDIYAWFKKLLMWPLNNMLEDAEFIGEDTKKSLFSQIDDNLIPYLTNKAKKLPIEKTAPLAIDWLNGRRTPDANQLLKGAITNITLGTDAPAIFKALVESTAFGAKKITDRFTEEGVRIDGIIALGGVAKKSPYVMQVVADVLNMPIKVARSEQACALGAAMAASVAAGIHKTFEEAQDAMGNGFEKEYLPDSNKNKEYNVVYKQYNELGGFIENKLTN